MKDKKTDWRRIWSKIVARAWTDEIFKQRLLKDPKGVFVEFGLKLPKEIKNIKSHADSETLHIMLPKNPVEIGDLTEEQIQKIAGGGDWGDWASNPGSSDGGPF